MLYEAAITDISLRITSCSLLNDLFIFLSHASKNIMYSQACRQVKIFFVPQIYVPYTFIWPGKYTESS